jgi:phage-related protein
MKGDMFQFLMNHIQTITDYVNSALSGCVRNKTFTIKTRLLKKLRTNRHRQSKIQY